MRLQDPSVLIRVYLWLTYEIACETYASIDSRDRRCAALKARSWLNEQEETERTELDWGALCFLCCLLFNILPGLTKGLLATPTATC